MVIEFTFTNRLLRRNRVQVHPDGVAYVTCQSRKIKHAKKIIDATGIPVNRIIVTVPLKESLIHNGKKPRK